MTRPRRNLRLFVAVYPPHELAELMVAAADEAARQVCKPRDEEPAGGGYRLTPAEQVHLTLQFVGDVAVRDLDRVQESVGRAAGGLPACVIQPQAIITLPPKGAARLLAIACDAPATVLELKRRLASRLARETRERSDDHFLPHLTVCRFRTPRHVELLRETLSFPSFPCREIRLMRSVLGPNGAQHREIEVYPLTGA